MRSLANKTTLWNLMAQIGIQIPIIQRDYAQGRKGKESLREQFLEDLKNALDKSIRGGKEPAIQLDFIYGIKDTNYFIPIDGQQRLTTLWLMHWYIAYRAGKLLDDDTCSCLKKFTYLTRDSSKAFCEKIVSEGKNLPNYTDGQNIADVIMNQTWMFNHWKQDPTVQSMLRMLSGVRDNDKNDGIEEWFGSEDVKTFESYWAKLTSSSPKDCPIVFYLLEMEKIGQSDELYVKMNGRGKPLTDFENFKADLIKYIDDKCREVTESSPKTIDNSMSFEWSKLNNTESGYANKLDNDWMDFFWTYRNSDISIEDMFFTFINRFLLVNLMQKFKDLDNSKRDSDDELEQKKRIAYDYLYSYVGKVSVDGSDVLHMPYSDNGFKIYKNIFNLLSHNDDKGCTLLLKFYQMMENIVTWQKNFVNRDEFEELIKDPYSSSDQQFKFVFAEDKATTKKENRKKNLYQLIQTHQIAFWAVCHFFSSEQSKQASKESLKKWMRIIWNICSVPSEIQTKDIVITAISNLADYVKNPIDAIGEFRRITLPTGKNIYNMSNFDKHIREEREKAIHMLWNNGKYYGGISSFSGKTWENVINTVEREEFFKGNIHCLFDQYGDDNISISWEDFDKRYNNLMLHKSKNFGVDSLKSTLLVSEYRIRNHYWYKPKSNDTKISQNWRDYLLDYNKDVTEWLNNYGPVPSSNQISEYHLDLLVNTNLLELVEHKYGVHLGKNSRTGIPVLMYHQASLPYILFDEKRNEILGELITNGSIIGDKTRVIMLNDTRNVLNGATIEFKYVYASVTYKFKWNASGEIVLTDDKSGKSVEINYNNCPGILGKILKYMIMYLT